MTIQDIKEDGFLLNKTYEKIQDISFISLRISIRAYFNTFKAIYGNINRIYYTTDTTQEDQDKALGKNYIEDACQAIISFHHFIELIVKDVLTKIHPLLAIDASLKHEIYYELIFNKNPNEIDLQKIKQLEFSIALDRLVTLIEKGKVNEKYKFIAEAKDWLQTLNYLRNRIVHRGIYVTRYKALDHLFGMYALPMLQKIIALPEYNNSKLWQHKQLEIGIDPITEIVSHFNSRKKYNPYTIAMLKELGRAAYENPIHFGGEKKDFLGIDKDTRTRAEVLAKHICEEEYCDDVEKCPVCGVKSLVLFNDSFETFNKDGEQDGMQTYIYKLTCFCCSFDLKNEGKMSFKKAGFTIQNYWRD